MGGEQGEQQDEAYTKVSVKSVWFWVIVVYGLMAYSALAWLVIDVLMGGVS